MSVENTPVKCAKCNVPLESASVDPKPNDVLTCPSCGISETYENVTREIEEYVNEKAQDHLAVALDNAARKSKIMSVKHGHRTKKSYRFIVDLNL